MINSFNEAVQTVATQANVTFLSTRVRTGSCCGCGGWLNHDNGSGIFTITKPGIYRIHFNGNVAIPTGGTVAPITVAITQSGEVLQGSEMVSTPAAVETFNNISSSVLVRVPCNVGAVIGVKNIGTDPISVEQANIVIDRVC